MKFWIAAGIILVASIMAAQAPGQGVKVTGKVVNFPPEGPFYATGVRLDSQGSPKFSIQAPLRPDHSFEIERAPAGAYRATLVGAPRPAGSVDPLRGASSPMVTVGTVDVSDVVIDMGNNPFPELPGGSLTAVFSNSTAEPLLQLRGVMTQDVVYIRQPAKVLYFRMNVKDEATGSSVPWAVLLPTDSSPTDVMTSLKLSVGSPITLTGVASRDGTNRIAIRQDGRINGMPVPRIAN
jgi:hypothetical protein